MTMATAGTGSAYTIDNSLLMQDSHFHWTPAGAGNRQIWTLSFWHKRCLLGDAFQTLFSLGTGANDIHIGFSAGDVLAIYEDVGGIQWQRNLSMLFRDPSVFFHLVIAMDTTQATAADRLKIYIDGEEITDFSASIDPSLNYNTQMNTTIKHWAFSDYNTTPSCELICGGDWAFIDGTQYAASDFGEVHPDNNAVWIPKDISGLTFGTNGRHLEFKDGTSTTTLGYDSAGSNNVTLVSGATTDQLTDTPTNNHCVLSPISKSGATLSEGNTRTTWATHASTRPRTEPTMFPTSGKWYCEVNVGTFTYIYAGIMAAGVPLSTYFGSSDNDVAYMYEATAAKLISNNVQTSWGTTIVNNDIIGMAWDVDTGKVWFSRNNTWQVSGDPAAGTNPAHTFSAAIRAKGLGPAAVNYASFCDIVVESSKFSYTPPTGFLALSSNNLPTPAILDPKDYFDPTLYTGNGATRTIATQNKCDLVVVKNRSQADEWKVVDAVRGATKEINWDSLNLESTDANGVTAFGASSGFDLGTGAGGYNDNTENFVAYPWKESAIAGFDIVSYTGNGVNRTIAHNLGSTPEFMLIKRLTGTIYNWAVYHKALTATKLLSLDDSGAAQTNTFFWNDTEPTASVFTVGTSGYTNNDTYNYIAYLFASIEGYSKVFSYTGNGSADGPFVWCGFKPKLVIIKSSTQATSWFLWDDIRETYNAHQNVLYPDLTTADSPASAVWLDMVGNGIKVRTATTGVNTDAAVMVGIAFAEYPFALMNNSALAS